MRRKSQDFTFFTFIRFVFVIGLLIALEILTWTIFVWLWPINPFWAMTWIIFNLSIANAINGSKK